MRRVRLLFPAAVGVLALLVSACASSGASNTPSGSGPEKTHITVATLPIPDAAPLFIAIHRGFFKKQGLTVTPEIITNTPASAAKLAGGELDFSAFNYVSTFEQEENGPIKFRLVADSSESSPDYFDIMVAKNSGITSPAQLKGKTLGVPALNAIGTLGVLAVLKPYGITQNQLNFAVVPFPAEPAALAQRKIDAAVEVEPFVTQMEATMGARPLADIMSGATANFPLAGWGTTDTFVKKYPKTVAAFQRAMAQAQQIAATDRKAVEQILPTFTQIPPRVASVMTLCQFPTTISAIRLQRAADLMLQFGLIHRRLDVAPMIVPAPKS